MLVVGVGVFGLGVRLRWVFSFLYVCILVFKYVLGVWGFGSFGISGGC